MHNSAKILWTTDNKETALNMLFLYAHSAIKKGWIDDVTILIWGASQNLVAQDEEVQEKIKEMVRDGVKVIACKKCADNLDVLNALISCDVDVFHTGETLSTWIKTGENVITI